MGINALLYAGCMTAAQQIFDTMVRQQEADNDDVHNDDDNEVVDWDPDVAIVTDFILRHDKDSVNNNDAGGNREDKELDSLFNHGDDDTNIDGEGGSGAASNNDTNMDMLI